jgi:uncharacterized membrane protein
MKNIVLSLKSRSLLLLRTEVDRWLVASMLFSVLLVAARILYTRHLTFIFLTWNLFLAFVPYFISSMLWYNQGWIKSKIKFIVFFISWLLFIPNSFYIVTDLFHLGISNVPIWFDLALLLSFAWNGLLLGILSVRQMEKIMQVFLRGKHELFFLYPVMCLNAFGIYIGRYLRYNSWDVVSDPFELLADISVLLLHPLGYKYAWGMIICYSILMTFIYITIKKISKSIL